MAGVKRPPEPDGGGRFRGSRSGGSATGVRSAACRPGPRGVGWGPGALEWRAAGRWWRGVAVGWGCCCTAFLITEATPVRVKVTTFPGGFFSDWYRVAIMRIPSRSVLAGQLHCLSEDGAVVITVQHWQDPQAPAERPVSWLRLVRNGRPRSAQQFAGMQGQASLHDRWRSLEGRYAATALTEDEMWRWLGKLARIQQAECASAAGCRGRLVVAWPFCPACGRDERRVASGSLSGVRRREVLLDLRKPSGRSS